MKQNFRDKTSESDLAFSFDCSMMIQKIAVTDVNGYEYTLTKEES